MAIVVIFAGDELPPPVPPAPVVPVVPVVELLDVVEPVGPLVTELLLAPPAPLRVVVASSPPHPQEMKSATLEHRRTGRSEPKALAKLNIVQQCHGVRKRLNENRPWPDRFRGRQTSTALLAAFPPP
jgi:hypothetical protein